MKNISKPQSNKEFITSDIALSASLVCLNFKLLYLDRSGSSSNIKFVFENKPEIEKVVNQYWNNELLINPRSLFDNYKMLKKRLFSE